MSLPKLNIKIYNDVLRTEATWPFDVGTLLMRALQFMFTLGTVSMMTLAGYSAFIAGSVAAVLSIAQFFISPRVSRQIDLRGQSKIVPIVSAICLLGLAGLLLTIALDGPLFCAYLAVLLMAFYPNGGAMARTRWAYIIHTNQFNANKINIRTAYAYEGIVDDIAFMFSPALAIALNSLIHPVAGMAAGGIMFAIGSLLLTCSKSTEPIPGWKPEDNPNTPDVDESAAAMRFYQPDSPWVTQSHKSVIALSKTVLIIFLCFVMVGMIFGAYDSTVVVVCQNLEMPTYASFIMSYSGIISACAGFLFGMISFKTPIGKMLIVTGIIYGLTYCTTALSFEAITLFITITIASPFYAPWLITANSAIEHAIPGERLTEGITWMNTGNTLGFAIGPTAAGALIDTFGATSGFSIVAVATLTLVAILLISRKTLAQELISL